MRMPILFIFWNRSQKKGMYKKGGELDIDKAAALLLDDFRAGKLGRISLERPAVVKDK